LKLFLRISYSGGTADEKSKSFGINTANTELLINLLRYSRECREFGLIVNDPEDANSLKDIFPDKLIHCHGFKDPKELNRVLQYYDIFFMGGYGIRDILQCEGHFNDHLSVIGITHSLHLEEIAGSIREASKICSSKDALVCISSSAKSSIERMLQSSNNVLKLETIPLGVDTGRYRPVDAEAKKKLRAQFSLPEYATIFLCLGRLSPDEKIELAPLLKAFADLLRISESGEKAYLLILGREHNKGYVRVLSDLSLKLGIENNIRIIIEYKPKDIPLYYAAADIFISPSDNIQETFGLAVVEAMASGLPCIVSDWDGYRDTVVDGETGFLIPTYWADCGIPWNKRFQLAQSVAVDMDSLILSMQTLLENSDLRSSMGENARHHVKSVFSWKEVIKQYDRLFRQVSSKERARSKQEEANLNASAAPTGPSEIFNAYPTRFVTAESHIRLRDQDSFAAYPDVIQLVDMETANYIAGSIAQGITNVGEIAHLLMEKDGASYHKTIFQMMVMMKYGVFSLEVSPPVQSDSHALCTPT